MFLFFLSGCVKTPSSPETPADFRRFFAHTGQQPPLQRGDLLTLTAAIETALANNPTNQRAVQSVYAAKYSYDQALSAYLPEINAGYSLGHTLSRGWDLKDPPEGMLRKNNHFVTSGTLRTTFLLFDGFARELDRLISLQEYQKSIELSRNVKRLLKRAVSYAYYDMYLAGEEIKIHQADLAFQNAALQQEEQRFLSGHVSKASVLNFKIFAARARSHIRQAEYRKKTALHALTALMGCGHWQIPENLTLQKIVTDPLPDLREDDFYLELAVNNRPDLKAEKILLEIARLNRQKVYAGFLPAIHLFAEFSLDTYQARYSHSSAHGNLRGFSYGAAGSWNLFKGFETVSRLRRQTVLERIALWEVANKFLEISAEIKDACANCKNAHYQVRIFQDMTEWVREQRDLVFSEYRNGRETITRLNEAQSVLIEAQSRLIVSAIEFNKAAIQLAAASGRDISAIVGLKKKPSTSISAP